MTLMRYNEQSPIHYPIQLIGPLTPPIFSVSSRPLFSEVVDHVQRDLFNAAGVMANELVVDFEPQA